jgi:pyruvate, orthophosphate dikinase
MAKAVAKSKKIAAKSKPSAPTRKAAAPARQVLKKAAPKSAPKSRDKAPAKPATKAPARPVAKTAAKGSAVRPALQAIKPNKWVFTFGDGKAEGKAEMRDLLGGKGANLAEMANLGLPVPPGFTIPTSVCTYFYEHEKTYPK